MFGRLCIVATVIATTSASKWPLRAKHADDVPASFDCSMRKLAYKYGKQQIPRMGKFESLYYALDLNSPDCNTTMTGGEPDLRATRNDVVPPLAVYVHPLGRDTDDGSVTRPLRSIQLALDTVAARTDGSPKTVVLRGGTHYISDTIHLGSKHSNIKVMAYPGEAPVVSGGVKLNVQWTKAQNDVNNTYVANIKGQVDEVPGLILDNVFATRARYPNIPGGLETSCGYGCMVSGGDAKWTPPNFSKYGNVTYYTDSNPNTARNITPDNWFQHYMIGVNGLCSVYDPPVSYWCSQNPSGGGAFAFRTPSGLTPKQGALPNSPYKDPSTALFFVWRPARWANWMFEIGDYDVSSDTYTFGKGGNQGARGNNNGGDFFIENVMEELDYPGEFFADMKAGMLYLNYNGTGAPPTDMEVVVPSKQVLLNASGTQWDPVTNVQFKGITYTATSYTYMMPHGVPSAGDWALDRYGAIFLQGTEGAVFDSCTFDHLGGNAVMVSGYNRNATVTNSDFSYIGGNSVAAWGYTNETATDPGRPGVAIENYPQAGVDGTDGNHPRYTTITSCTSREVGLYEKQSSFYVQAKTAQSIISGNVFFNGPRAGINANDGFGGGDEISHNLVFSTCRESGDHGPFNSWDRQPFQTTIRTGQPDMIMQWREIHHNFFVDNYSPQEDVDNDDGSAYYHTHDNFLVYGGQGMKNDFGGHDNHHFNNVYGYVGKGLGVCSQLDGHEDYFYGNKVVMTGTNVGGLTCSGTGKTVVHDNEYFTPSGTISECNMALDKWQAQGEDKGSTVAAVPTDETIMEWASVLLGIQD